MNKPKNIDAEFYNWFKENWMISGGLITPIVAAQILNKSKTAISLAMKRGQLEVYTYKNKSFLSIVEINKLAVKEIYIYMEEETEKEMNKFTEIYCESLEALKGKTITFNEDNLKTLKREMQDYFNYGLRKELQETIAKTNPLK